MSLQLLTYIVVGITFATYIGIAIWARAGSTKKATDNNNKNWLLSLPSSIGSGSIARLALKASNAFYFAETSLQFSEYKTTFDKNFRK